MKRMDKKRDTKNNKINLLYCSIAFLLAITILSSCTKEKDKMITHSVFFNLKHAEGSAEEAEFLRKAMELSNISSVRNLEYVREVSPKNNYDFGLIMQFEDQSGYNSYNEHPDHVDFVENIWKPEVEDFIEIDYVKQERRNDSRN